jgi:hypothetical protein
VSDVRDDPACQGCRFWQSENGEMGDCRRHAPRPIMDAQLPRAEVPEGGEEAAGEAFWPITFASDWCGEFKERPDVFRPSWGPR